jgi:hypothetical protein
VHAARRVRDVPDWRLCTTMAVNKSQARWEYTVCVLASGLHHPCTSTRTTLRQARWNHFQTMPRNDATRRLSHFRKSTRALLQARRTWGVPRARLHLQSSCGRMVQEARRPVQFQEMKLCSCTVCRWTERTFETTCARPVCGHHGPVQRLIHCMVHRADVLASKDLHFERTHLLPIRTLQQKNSFAFLINL